VEIEEACGRQFRLLREGKRMTGGSFVEEEA